MAGSLQHPRRSLGDRYRSQANKFLKLAESDPSRQFENNSWAEQNARQALLHDFTHPDNWRVLADIKQILQDEIGLRALLMDLFTVLGRDPEHLSQLEGVSIAEVGRELLEAALSTDHLDPDIWYASLDEQSTELFSDRFSTLDLSDPRCNVLFGRRVERLWQSKGDELCIPLARMLVANRPQNFEMWIHLGRAYERRQEFDEAWLCYDQAQSQAPHLDVRDSYRARIELRFETLKSTPWTQPTIQARDQFLQRMQSLALEFAETTPIEEMVEEDHDADVNPEELQLQAMLNNGQFSAAFFLSRRLVTRGEDWAIPYMEQAKSGLEQDDEVIIP